MIGAESRRYTTVAIVLHWTIALLLIGQIAGGFFMHNLPDADPRKFELFQLHKSFGISILLLTIVRLGWRLGHKPPPLPAGMAGWERAAARGAHVGFYFLLIALPLVGWALVSVSPLASSIPTYLFGVVPWPHLPLFETVADREAVADAFAEIHEYLAFAAIGLIAVHVGAALKHHFVNRDDVLARMLPLVKARR